MTKTQILGRKRSMGVVLRRRAIELVPKSCTPAYHPAGLNPRAPSLRRTTLKEVEFIWDVMSRCFQESSSLIF